MLEFNTFLNLFFPKMAQALNDPYCGVSSISDEGIESASSSHEDKNCDNCKKQLLGLIYSIGAA